MKQFRLTAAMMAIGLALLIHPCTLFAHEGDESPCDELAEDSSGQDVTTFPLYPDPTVVGCLTDNSGSPPTAVATVKRGKLNDRMCLRLEHIKPGLNFDLFTVERSKLRSDGTVDPDFANKFNKSFGLAWYQSDIEIKDKGKKVSTGTVTIKTILLDQIFGFDADIGLQPVNTFEVGFWFNDPKDAATCGFTGFTPFNGEHHAGPLAMISVPNPDTHLGPLCTHPDTSTNPPHCNP